MSLNKGLLTSNTDIWETPQELFDELNNIYGFETDVCALPENAKCARYFTPEQDGLKQDWTGVCWTNPQYGRKIGKWVQKAYEAAAKNGATVVCLLPARTDTTWWHDYCMHGDVTFIRGRLKFGGSKNSAPFPSAIVVFRATKERDALSVNQLEKQLEQVTKERDAAVKDLEYAGSRDGEFCSICKYGEKEECVKRKFEHVDCWEWRGVDEVE